MPRDHHLVFSAWRALIRALAIPAAFSVAIFPFLAEAASSSIRLPGGRGAVSAEKLFRDFDKGTLEVSGNVKIVYDGQSISADSAIVNERDQTLTLKGNVVIASTQAYVEGTEAVLNYRDNTGVFYDAFLKSGQVIFEGSVLKKSGEKTYEAENAFYTACDTCPPSWSFSGSKISAELGGYAAITKPLFRIGNVPVFWFPYLVVPLKSERQTGFLVPKFEFTAKTPGIGLPFFWAISRSQDATFTPKYYTKRGLKLHTNYRYVIDENSEGELNTAIIRDKLFSDEQTEKSAGRDIGPKKNRWFLAYDHKYELPYDFSQKVKLNMASDLRYSRDFPNEMEGQGDPALENRMSLTRETELTHSSFEIDYYINQIKDDQSVLASNEDAVHRWPEIRYSVRDTPIFNRDLLFRFNGNYVNFARKNYAFDDVTLVNGVKTVDPTRSGPGGGVFDPSLDLIRAGQRLDLTPELSYPFQVGRFIEALPVLQVRHTQYSFNLSPPQGSYDPTPYRQYVRGELSIRTRFSSVYGASDSGVENSRRYLHEVIPEVIASGVPYYQETSSPFFGEASKIPVFLNTLPVDDSAFLTTRGLQFDYNDRLLNRNSVSFVLNNRLVRKTRRENSAVYEQIASWKLGQTYDLDEARKVTGPSFPWSSVYSLLDVRLDDFLTNTEVRYFPYHRVATTTARARYLRGQTYVGARFIQNFRVGLDVDAVGGTRSDEVGFEFGFNTRYLKFASIVAFQPSGLKFADYVVKSYGTEVVLKPPGNCWGIAFAVKQLYGDDIAYDLNFEYNFGGASI